MREATLDDLRHADEHTDGYYPVGFDYAGEMARVAALRAPLQTLLGCSLEQSTGIQDASFFTDLYASDPVPDFLVVRFSAWGHYLHGNFFCLWGSSPSHPLTDDVRLDIVRVVSDHGYLYVPNHLLALPHPEYGCWQVRYFDYV